LNSKPGINALKPPIAKPPWLKVKAYGNKKYLEVRTLSKEHNLHTVCQEANCPNRGECFTSGTATFLIMGPNCSRNCSFCNVTHSACQPLDSTEPDNVARTVELLKLKHAVITSVTRDDLPDGGANHFRSVIKCLKRLDQDLTIEVLTPDFQGVEADIETVLSAEPDVFNHNIETVPRLYKTVRPQANYAQSLKVLKFASEYNHSIVKSGLMVGLGEQMDELDQVFIDLSKNGVVMLTIGQYLAPSLSHHPVISYYHPDQFDQLAIMAREAGIKSVFSGPLVRSSYHAGHQFRQQ